MFTCYRYDMFLLCIMFNYNIYNQANECSVKVDVWICLTALTKTTETNCKIAISSLFLLNVYNTVFYMFLFVTLYTCFDLIQHSREARRAGK